MPQNHVHKRGNTYFFRRRVPTELQETLGRKEIKKALGTSDRKKAGRLATIETLKSDELFEAARQENLKLVSNSAPKPITYEEALPLVSKWYAELEASSEEWLEDNLEIFQHPEDLKDALEVAYRDQHAFSGGGDGYKAANGRSQLRTLLTEGGFEFNGSDREFKKLAALVRKAHLENAQNDIARLTRTPVGHTARKSRYYIKEFPQHLPIETPQFSATVSEILNEFVAEQKEKGRSEATIRTYSVPIRFLREVLGEKTILASVDRDQMKKVRQMILSLPANAKKRFPGKTLQQSIELAKQAGIPSVESKTADNYLGCIQSIFNFAERIRKIPYNPIGDEFFSRSFTKRATHKAQFTIAQLNRLFSSNHYTSTSASSSKPGRFWVPLIALFEGMRSNEICQLYTEDVIEVDSIWCIRIDDLRIDGSECEKNLKTKSSRRTIPIHPELLKIGFLDFVEERRKDRKSSKLFPDLTLGKNGYYSDPFQKWFGRFLESTLGKQAATLHSFRHMWKDVLTEANASETLVKRLGGWTGDSSASAKYGKGPSATALLNALKTAHYPGLKIDHLVP